MHLTHATRLLLLYGFIFLCATDILCKQIGRTKKSKSSQNTASNHGRTQRLNYKNLSKHLLKRLDLSCRNSTLPDIHNGKFVKFKKTRIEAGRSKTKQYMVAEFKCNEGYKFRTSLPKKMFCSKNKWVGKKPICDKIKNSLDELGDDPNASSPQNLFSLGECSAEDRAKCKHVCYMRKSEVICDCLPGFRRDGGDCKDINECETNNGGCHHTCANNLGSFSCSCSEGFRISSDGRSCEDVNECHLKNGHGPCQDTCENTYGSYKCSCINLVGTRLAADLHTCSDVNECTEGSAGCSHSCVDAHGRTFCTCPDGMELGPDWKTCHDINECEKPKIKEFCRFGCINFIGSYYCKEPSSILLSDESDNETVSLQSEDDYEDEDYEDEDYEDEEYEDAENYDEVTEQDINQEHIVNQTVEEKVENNLKSEQERESDKTIKRKYESPDKEEFKNILITTSTPTTVSINNTEISNAKIEEENYDDYDDEYDREMEGKESETTGGKSTKKIVTIDNNKEVPDNSLSSSTNIGISTAVTMSNHTDKKEEHYYTTENNTFDLSKKEIHIKQDENYDEEYNKSYTTMEVLLTPEDNDTTSTTSKIDITKEIENRKYDENYDEEYYDGYSNKKGNSTENTTNGNIPEVDINNVNINIQKIIKINMQNATDKFIDVTTAKTAGIPENNDDDYEYDDYEEEDYKELKKVESKPLGKEVSKCEKGFTLIEDGECSDLDECKMDGNPCSDGCQNTIGSYQCTCPTGFTISPSDPHTCQDVNECLENPCSHTCVNQAGSYYCECPSGLTLQNNTCLNLTCSHGQTKINRTVQCTCPLGYILSGDGRTCEDVDECQLQSLCSHTCRNTIGSYECGCEVGFELTNGTSCVDIDECKAHHGCPQLCTNLPGSFQCSCEEGYEYYEKENACIDVNECEDALDLDECNQLCVNYEGGYECACYSGYKLGSDDATCEDIDECSASNGNCSQICINKPGTYECGCKTGYILNNDNETCEVSDPCLIENGGCSHQCVNENGVAVCKCPKGQVLEGRECYKVDPCVANNGGCSHVCVNANGAVRCECPKGYELQNVNSCVQINPCTINNGNCSHFCEFVDGHVNCLCPNLYELHNKTHCVEVDPCTKGNGGCSHICTFENNAVICSCPSTHELSNRTHCFERNPCLIDNGGCSHICNFSNGLLSCSCPEDFFLSGKTCNRVDPCLKNNGGCSHQCYLDDQGQIKCFCPDKFELKEDKKTCSPKDPCLVNNGHCSHICNSSTGSPVCTCPDGYKLKNKTHCEKFDPCLMENGGCSHGCENVKGLAKCLCPEGYALVDENNCNPIDPCLEDNGGCSHGCTNVDDQVQCSCPDHYNLENGTTCVPVDPCLINNGGCSHECFSESDEVFCMCPEGYKLHGKKCVAVNPCETKNGGCSHVCSSINGRVICKCPPGHELIDKTCFKINPCLINNGGCSHSCSSVNGQAKCTCPPGYKLFGKKCSDEDPCSKNNGGCSHYCHSKEGRRECSCPPGYILRPNKRVCKDVNECKNNRGGCSHGCKNLPGSLECTCPNGFKLDTNSRTCVDVDECQINNGNCQMICRNFKGGFRCDCPDGYALQRDKRSCKATTTSMRCRSLRAPRNGIMRCSGQSEEPIRTVPSGTKCNMWCNEGLKLEGSSQRVCNSSGMWEGEDSVCVGNSCPSLPNIVNGWYLPGVCNTGKVFLGDSCRVYCRKGFKRNLKILKYICGEDFQWSPSVVSETLNSACVKEVSNVYIKCPGNGALQFILPSGQRQMLVKIPKPETNVDFERYVTSNPTWGSRLETTLPAGRSLIRFTAMTPGDFNSTSASCSLTITVVDKESPRVVGCPENIQRTLVSGETMKIVHWLEPNFYDNVGITTVYKSRESGTEFGLGLHHISYIASDEAGNRAFCHFSVDIRDEYDSEVANSIRDYATYTNHNTAGRYRAVLMCPNGVQYSSNVPASYSKMLTSKAGCYWRHVRVTRPLEPEGYKISEVHSESRLPPGIRANRRSFFKWNR